MTSTSEIVDLLKAHDWFYEWSDDGSVFSKGHSERAKIMAVLAELPFEEAAALYDANKPARIEPYRRPIAK